MNKIFIMLSLVFTSLFSSEQKYTIAVCATSTLDYALVCKKRIFDNMRGEVFIVKQDGRYFTNLNIYEDKEIAKVTIKNASKYVLEQKPYIKEIEQNIVERIDKRKLFIDMDEDSKKPIQKTYEIKKSENNQNEVKEIIVENKEDKNNSQEKSLIPLVSLIPDNLEIVGVLPYKDIENEELKQEQSDSINNEIDYGNMYENKNISKEDEDELLHVSMDEFDTQSNTNQKTITQSKKKTSLKSQANKNIKDYEEIIIKVDSKTNIMEVFAKINNQEKMIKSYIVSTGKDSIKKPLGVGRISQISLNPIWYPTEDTKKSFAKRGINLPNVVPPNHKYNYMGLAKLNLTHSVDGKTTYRIHGTLNEKTLGSNESAGCIRMRNIDVVELAKIIEEFSNLNKVKVILI